MNSPIKLIFFYLAAIITMATTCIDDDKNHHSMIKIINNSTKGIYYRMNTIYKNSDTLFISDYNPVLDKLNFYCDTNGSNKIWTRSTFEGDFKRGAEYLQIIIFDEEIIQTIPFDTIRKYDMTLKRYNLTLEDLQALRWEVTYPPTEEMKKVNQYPPYGSE